MENCVGTVVIVGSDIVYVKTARVTAVFSDVLDLFLVVAENVLSQEGR